MERIWTEGKLRARLVYWGCEDRVGLAMLDLCDIGYRHGAGIRRVLG